MGRKPEFGSNWWAQRWTGVLESFGWASRLRRGRAYARAGNVLAIVITPGTVEARVQGSRPQPYRVTIALNPLSDREWEQVTRAMAGRAVFAARLLAGEMPENIEEAFAAAGVTLFPRSARDLRTACSCPDWANPCKHVAGVCYLLASALDQDPFLLFELRGLARDQLRAELEKSPLGQLLASEFDQPEVELRPAPSYFTRPVAEPAPATVSYKEFWTGAKRLPPTIETAQGPSVPALLIKKQGDYPPFWPKDQSFVAVMEDLYERVRTKSPQMK